MEQLFLSFIECECPQGCDCQNPPPDDWDGKSGCFGLSNLCPVHNWDPIPEDHCMLHGEYTPEQGA